jgi:hypothetical protein
MPGFFLFWRSSAGAEVNTCYHVRVVTFRAKQTGLDRPAELALRLTEALQRERVVPRFVDSYVVENGRQALQVHAGMYRDLLALVQREALLAMTVRALEVFAMGPETGGRKKSRPLTRKNAVVFRRKLLAAFTRQQKWTAGDALDFQKDLQIYEELLARSSPPRRSRKPFEAASHPFVDRCAFVLDSSFLEKARLAASRALFDLEELAATLAAQVLEYHSR